MSHTSRKNSNSELHENGMELVERLEAGSTALRARDLAKMFGVTQQHIYKLAALGIIPSFRIGTAVRFDPRSIAEWLRQSRSSGFAGASNIRIAV